MAKISSETLIKTEYIYHLAAQKNKPSDIAFVAWPCLECCRSHWKVSTSVPDLGSWPGSALWNTKFMNYDKHQVVWVLTHGFSSVSGRESPKPATQRKSLRDEKAEEAAGFCMRRLRIVYRFSNYEFVCRWAFSTVNFPDIRELLHSFLLLYINGASSYYSLWLDVVMT